MLDFEWRHKNVIPTLFVVAAVRQWEALHQLWKHDDERCTHQPLGGRAGLQKQNQNGQVRLSMKRTVHSKIKSFFFLVHLVLFINLDCFDVSCLVLQISAVEISAFSPV